MFFTNLPGAGSKPNFGEPNMAISEIPISLTGLRNVPGLDASNGVKSARDKSAKSGSGAEARENKSAGNEKLSRDEQREVEKLKQTDKQVRAHEAAHVSAGGRYIKKAATYTFKTGPDGKRYAVGGEVSIDVSEAQTPEATIQKMRVVRAAALAPADPSSQDYTVANKAAQKSAEAHVEKSREIRESAGTSEADDKSDAKAINSTAATQRSSGAVNEQTYSEMQKIAGSYTRGAAPENRNEKAESIINLIG